MSDYIKREDAIKAVCAGCNSEFPNEPCEPKDCKIRQRIAELRSIDSADRRYIDAEKLKKRLLLISYGDSDTFLQVMKKIDDAPSADVVEVVMCKDCKYNCTDDCAMIHGQKMYKNLFDNDFCSFGERANT